MAQPIWKDYYIQLNGIAGQPHRFQVETLGEVIYQGTAYPRKPNGFPRIKINDICANYLRNNLPQINNVQYTESENLQQTFSVYDLDVAMLQPYHVTFIADWSYDKGVNYETMVINSAPIRKTFVEGQYIFIGYFNAPEIIQGTITNADGTTIPIEKPVMAGADFNNDFGDDFFINDAAMGGIGTLTIDMRMYPDAVKVQFGDMVFTRKQGCYRYALHYVNAYGGWDSMWMSSGVITDAFTRKTAMHLYDNRNVSTRGKVNFANPYTRKWQLHTGWLNGEQGGQMHHLIGSTDVYLQDITTGDLMPVNITDSNCEHKSYKSNGGKLVDYTINCELSRTRIRL